MISLIIPSYNEQDNIAHTYETIDSILQKEHIPYEIIFVDDGSIDNTYVNICALANKYSNVKGLSFSRNFGKESAIFAGLEAASGDCAIIMDCDLQHPPTLIPRMYELWKQGYEVVEAVKSDRGKESAFHRACANSFYHILSKITGLNMKNASDFKLLDRKAIDSLLIMPERTPFFRALSSWVGFRTIQVELLEPFEVCTSKYYFIFRGANATCYLSWLVHTYFVRYTKYTNFIPLLFRDLRGRFYHCNHCASWNWKYSDD